MIIVAYLLCTSLLFFMEKQARNLSAACIFFLLIKIKHSHFFLSELQKKRHN